MSSPSWASVSLLGDGERAPLRPVGGAWRLRLSPALPSFFVLVAQCALAWHSRPLWAAQPGGAPRPRYQRREAAAGAGGASLGRRPRHVLDTGLSGLEPPHKGPGRRRNKGLFHAATEKPQISSRVLRRRGGAAGHPPTPTAAQTPRHRTRSARVPGLGPPRRPPLSCSEFPSPPPRHVQALNSAPGAGGPGPRSACFPVLRVWHRLPLSEQSLPDILKEGFFAPLFPPSPDCLPRPLDKPNSRVTSYGTMIECAVGAMALCQGLCPLPAVTAVGCKLLAPLPSCGN